MASKWSKVSALVHTDSNLTLGELGKQAKFSRNTRGVADLSKAIARFNTLAQTAYDGAVTRQRLTIAGSISAKFAKSTLKAVVSSAISTFGPGALTDVAFGDAFAGGGTDYATGWSGDNVAGKGFDYALGGNGGYMEAGSSGMSRLAENAIKAGIGVVTGKLQSIAEDAAYDRFGNNASDDVETYIRQNVTSAYITGAASALRSALPDLNSADPTVKAETGAHQAHDREGTGALIKEAVHQIDQLCYALNALNEMDEAASTWHSRTQFRKCREMVEFIGKMYWFRRKYNKTRHFMHKLKEDYVAVGMVMQDMDQFWSKHVRALELLAMRSAHANSSIAGSSGGGRVHLNFEQVGINDGAAGNAPAEKGQRNWRQVKL